MLSYQWNFNQVFWRHNNLGLYENIFIYNDRWTHNRAWTKSMIAVVQCFIVHVWIEDLHTAILKLKQNPMQYCIDVIYHVFIRYWNKWLVETVINKDIFLQHVYMNQ